MTSDLPQVVIISGLPCTGKTTLARRLAAALPLPLIAKDDIKERLFDRLGTGDREWSRRLGAASIGLLFLSVETLLRAGQSLIAEANFDPARATAEFLALQKRYPFHSIEIQCHAAPQVILARFRERDASGARHPGHIDPSIYTELAALAERGRPAPLALGGEFIPVDTTDFAQVDYGRILASIQAMPEGT